MLRVFLVAIAIVAASATQYEYDYSDASQSSAKALQNKQAPTCACGVVLSVDITGSGLTADQVEDFLAGALSLRVGQQTGQVQIAPGNFVGDTTQLLEELDDLFPELTFTPLSSVIGPGGETVVDFNAEGAQDQLATLAALLGDPAALSTAVGLNVIASSSGALVPFAPVNPVIASDVQINADTGHSGHSTHTAHTVHTTGTTHSATAHSESGHGMSSTHGSDHVPSVHGSLSHQPSVHTPSIPSIHEASDHGSMGMSMGMGKKKQTQNTPALLFFAEDCAQNTQIESSVGQQDSFTVGGTVLDTEIVDVECRGCADIEQEIRDGLDGDGCSDFNPSDDFCVTMNAFLACDLVLDDDVNTDTDTDDICPFVLNGPFQIQFYLDTVCSVQDTP